MKREVITTRDGSTTISIPDRQVTYHSIHGAIQESMHVFIQAGLHHALEQFSDVPVRLFEMGFGSGLNALLTAIEAGKWQRKVHYTSIEAYPLNVAESQALNYGQHFQQSSLYQLLHTTAWEQDIVLTPFFTLQKVKATLDNYATLQPFHLIYYDAFAPRAQPEMWTQGVFESLYNMLVPGGILTTYCSKGDVRRAMQGAGFSVTKLPGPKWKREMLRACRAGDA